jgi:metal-sulfur cluster biosynthetic enzyme
VLDALEEVVDPCSVAHGRPLSIVDMGLLRDLEIVDGVVTIGLYLTSPVCTMIVKFQEMAEAALLPIRGIRRVVIVADEGFDWPGIPAGQVRQPSVTGASVRLSSKPS